MSDTNSSQAWLARETARHYQIFTQKTTMYQELSRFMVELAGIKPGMRVLDLGCGTGITTQLVLQAMVREWLPVGEQELSLLVIVRQRTGSRKE